MQKQNRRLKVHSGHVLYIQCDWPQRIVTLLLSMVTRRRQAKSVEITQAHLSSEEISTEQDPMSTMQKTKLEKCAIFHAGCAQFFCHFTRKPLFLIFVIVRGGPTCLFFSRKALTACGFDFSQYNC